MSDSGELFDPHGLQRGSVVLLFHAEWSDQSRQMLDAVNALKDQEFNREITYVIIDAEKQAKFASMFQIKAVPVCVYLQDWKEVGRLNGVNPQKLSQDIEKYFFNIVEPPKRVIGIDDRIRELLSQARVVIFMKGSAAEPCCKFSRQLKQLLEEECNFPLNNENVKTFDILKDDEIREGLKVFSNWPTYPQLYIDTELIGGVDIIRDMCESGDLQKLLPTVSSTTEKITKLLKKEKIMLFMKGEPTAPCCGFSKQIVEILNKVGVDYGHFNILEDQKLREKLKEFSNWPTYPQLYVSGELLGGLDIVTEMYEDGSLAAALS